MSYEFLRMGDLRVYRKERLTSMIEEKDLRVSKRKTCEYRRETVRVEKDLRVWSKRWTYEYRRERLKRKTYEYRRERLASIEEKDLQVSRRERFTRRERLTQVSYCKRRSGMRLKQCA